MIHASKTCAFSHTGQPRLAGFANFWAKWPKLCGFVVVLITRVQTSAYVKIGRSGQNPVKPWTTHAQRPLPPGFLSCGRIAIGLPALAG